MKLFVQSTVFNKELVGKAILIEGRDVDGDKWDDIYLVNSVEAKNLILVNLLGRKCSLHMENFEGEHGMKLTVLTKGVKN